MSRVTLNDSLPPQTAQMKQFEKALVDLNRFYWFFRASIEIAKKEISTTSHLSQVLPEDLKDRLNIGSQEFLNETASVEWTARYSMLVLAVTAYEDYLSGVLKEFLYTHWKEENTYNIKFIPKNLPEPEQILGFIKDKAIEQKIQFIISEKYEKRHKSISKLINDFSGKAAIIPEVAAKLSSSACVVRNCIVHCAGNIDERGEQSLREFLPEIKVGEPLVLEESFLWKLLGALRDSARSIDVSLR